MLTSWRLLLGGWQCGLDLVRDGNDLEVGELPVDFLLKLRRIDDDHARDVWHPERNTCRHMHDTVCQVTSRASAGSVDN